MTGSKMRQPNSNEADDLRAMNRADRPKVDPTTQDCLNRSSFAKALADRIASWKGYDSLVIGLDGPWGSGKSTIKNFVKFYLREVEKSGESGAYLVEFTPWQFSGQERLFQEFAIAVGTGLPDTTQADKERREAWIKWANRLDFGAQTANAVAFGAFGLGDLVTGGVFKTLGKGMGITSKVIKAADQVQDDGTPSSYSMHNLDELRKVLRKNFNELSKPLLVVIDDIDRLMDDEIDLVFRMVKANSDFPNIVYLLLYDGTHVTQALKSIKSTWNDEFLRKIVQVPFTVPAPPLENIHQELFFELGRLFNKDGNISLHWSKERFSKIWSLGPSKYFGSLRDVYRYLNGFEFSLSRFRKDGALEVNLVDLFLIEILRIFEPELYKTILNASFLLGDDTELFDDDDALSLFLEDVEKRARLKKEANYLVRTLFPMIDDKSWQNGRLSQIAIRDKRVCCNEYFRRYFEFALSPSDLSEIWIEKVIRSRNDREKLNEVFKQAQKNGIFLKLLKLLEYQGDKLEKEGNQEYLLALADSVELSGNEEIAIRDGFFQGGADDLAYFTILRSMEALKGDEAKSSLVQSIIQESDSLTIPSRLLFKWISSRSEEDTDELYPPLDSCLEETLKGCVLKRMDLLAENQQLINHPRLSRLLLVWNTLDHSGCQTWLRRKLADRNSLMKTLLAFISVVTVNGGAEQDKEYYDREGLERYLALTEWEAAVQSVLKEDSQSPEGQRIQSAWSAKNPWKNF